MIERMNVRTATQYYDDLLTSIPHARERVLLQAMAWDSSEEIRALLKVVAEASARGVQCVVVCDVLSLSRINREARTDWYYSKTMRAMFNEARECGVTVHMVGQMKLNPFSGHNHIKAAIIDSVAYAGGGTNLTSKNIVANDLMILFDSESLSDYLWRILPYSNQQADTSFKVDSSTSIIVDAGVKNQSRILETAIDMVNRSSQAWYVSKLAPNGQLAAALSKVDTKYYFNTLKKAGYFDALAISIDTKGTTIRNTYSSGNYLHAKILICKYDDGSYEILTGSHNFNDRGVKYGTAEMSIHSSDTALVEQTFAFITSFHGAGYAPKKS